MTRWLAPLCAMGRRVWQWLLQWLIFPAPSRWRHRGSTSPPRRVFAQPKPKWVRNEVIRLKAFMPQAGCRMIAHHFNRRWAVKKDMTVSKTYVADTCRRHQYLLEF
ncbi:MAG: hypothetical protein ABIR36_16050 [Nitrospiraceae bacterium]